MAYCPKCQGEMKTMDVVCSQCGYDFPDDHASDNPFRAGPPWAFHPMANGILIAAQVLAGLLATYCLIGGVVGISTMQIGETIYCTVAAVLLASAVVIIGRVQQIQPK